MHLNHSWCAFAIYCLRLVSLFFFVGGIALYEKEEKALGDRIQELWIRLDDISKTSGSDFANTLRRFAAFTDAIFTRLLGKKLLSARALSVGLGTSTCLSYASLMLLGVLAPHITPHLPHTAVTRIGWPKHYYEPRLIVALVLAFAPLFWTRWYFLALWGLTILRLSVWPAAELFHQLRIARGEALALKFVTSTIVTLLVSYIADYFFIALNRSLLRKLQLNIRHAGLILTLTIGNIVLAFLIVLLPIGIAIALLSLGGVHQTLPVSGPLLLSSMFNLIDIVAASAMFIVGLFVFVYMYAFWPIILRPSYAVARFTLNERRAAIFASGTAIWGISHLLNSLCH